MFKFGFELEADDVDEDIVAPENRIGATKNAGSSSSQTLKSFAEISLSDILTELPSVISYSPLTFPLSDGTIQTTARRDLYDARFQVISQEQPHDANISENGSLSEQHELHFVEAPSDLISGVYEGGLKTWECSLDLAAYIHALISQRGQKNHFRRIIELGCGTAVPSLYLLHQLLATTEQLEQEVDFHLQDYNELVFCLVTVPNLILAWYMSPASEIFRQSQHGLLEELDPDQESDPLPPADPTLSGDLPITSTLIAAFLESLNARGIRIRLFSGSWDTFDLTLAGGNYDLVLTSETIYRKENLPSLVGLLHRACVDNSLAETHVSLARSALDLTLESSPEPYLCLVAAKSVYFGVGGGVSEFTNTVKDGVDASGQVSMVWQQNMGVKRSIMKVVWRR